MSCYLIIAAKEYIKIHGHCNIPLSATIFECILPSEESKGTNTNTATNTIDNETHSTEAMIVTSSTTAITTSTTTTTVTDMTETGPQYWLSVAQHVDSFKGISPGRNVLNILPVGTNDEKNPAARLDLAMISSQGQKRLGVGMYPEEMSALRIVPNGLPRVK